MVRNRVKLQGQRIAELRARLNVSKSAMASRLGFDHSRSYEHYEEGRTVLRFDRIAEWAAAFEVSELEFVTFVLGLDDDSRQ